MMMHDRLEASLDQIFPEFRSISETDGRVTSICETGDGWYPLLASLFDALAELARHSGVKFHARQIKEKYGTLRVYFDCTFPGADEDVLDIAELLGNAAEYLSSQHCETCGAPGKSSVDRCSMKTACEIHRYINGYKTDPQLINQLLNTPRVQLDLAMLPPMGRIDTTDLDASHRYKLSLIRYRSLPNYVGVRLTDIELSEHIGFFSTLMLRTKRPTNVAAIGFNRSDENRRL